MNEILLTKAANLIASLPEATLAQTEPDGSPAVSMVASLRANGLAAMWLSPRADSGVRRIAACREASVRYHAGRDHVTLTGALEPVFDLDMKQVLWSDDFLGRYSGIDDPAYGVFKFSAKQVSLFIGGETFAGELTQRFAASGADKGL